MTRERASDKKYVGQVCLMHTDLWVAYQPKQPHILFILADDWGWGDAGWGQDADIPTPRLEELRKDSRELMQFYSQPKCTPARAALMTGRYPYKMGLQTQKVFNRVKNNTLDLKYKLLPAYLKDLGYHTHMVGKWHLGHCNANATPIHRGFDTHFGSWTNTDDHFRLISGGSYDWNWQNEPYWAAQGTFTAHLITNHTQFILKKHFGNDSTKDEPLFMYVAHLVPHKPAMAPEKYITETKCKLIPERIRADGKTRSAKNVRRPYCGMVAAMDEGIGNITDTLRQLGVLDDFIIIVTSDNGGAMGAGASNWPLRGNSRYMRFLSERHTTGEYHGLVHMTDWLPTLLDAAQGDLSVLPDDIDGMSAWQHIKDGTPTDRHWMVYNIDSNRKLGALKFRNASHDFKLIYSNDTNREPGYRSWDPRSEAEQRRDPRRERYVRGGTAYFLYDLATNPDERPPTADNRFPDATKTNGEIFQTLKKKLKELTQAEMEVPTYYPSTDKMFRGHLLH